MSLHPINEPPVHDLDNEDLLPPETGKKKKSKKRNNRQAAKRKRLGTGFEEYFADAPTTPAEALLERKELYSSSVPFSQRIQTCIHRYRTRRRLNTELTLYFNEYMFLGGLDTYCASFSEDHLEDTALIPQLESCAAAAAATTTNQPCRFFDAATAVQDASSSRFYDGCADNWTVDFAGVAACFCSVSMLPLTDLEPELMDKAIGVVENFLGYVVKHDVCTEYSADVSEALSICRRARDEWPRLCRLKELLPGSFNLAASKTFGVYEAGDWSLLSQQEEACEMQRQMGASVIFHGSLVAAGQPAPKTINDYHLVGLSLYSLELVAVEMPSAMTTDSFRRLAFRKDDNAAGRPSGLVPLGRAVFRSAAPIEDGWVHPTPPDNLARDGREGNDKDDDSHVISLLLEGPILAEMTVGMKVMARVGELSNGVHFVKSFENMQPSFYVFLPQLLMKDYKPARLNDRPPPSIHDQSGDRDEEAGEEEEK